MKRDNYLLRAPNDELIKTYVESLAGVLLKHAELKICLTMKLHGCFKQYTKNLSNRVISKTACRIASNNLIHQVLAVRKRMLVSF